jgi:hypothetical protein
MLLDGRERECRCYGVCASIHVRSWRKKEWKRGWRYSSDIACKRQSPGRHSESLSARLRREGQGRQRKHSQEVNWKAAKRGASEAPLFACQTLSRSGHRSRCLRYALDPFVLVVLDFCLVFEDLAIQFVDQAVNCGVQIFRKTFNVYDVSS